jgi:hypothetical protein
MRPIQPYKHRHFPGHSYDLPGGGRWDDLWDLYAVSRISDHLLLAFQSFDLSSAGPHVARWLGELLPPLPLPLPESGHTDADEFLRILESASQLRSTTEELRSCFPKLTTQVYVQFFEALGFEHCSEQIFSPYYHEIVEVEETGGEADGVEITREVWPGLRFGDMMFARAGVSVKCPPTVMTKPIAERSTLYWAHKWARRPRRTYRLGGDTTPSGEPIFGVTTRMLSTSTSMWMGLWTSESP